ncbi:hypothetical protein ILUMI_07209 [Ignelater luminosus]|uniref:DUF4371 domain-containing protein n=1 Tax=Ignelater luminosus TaxID=2038154 RepID=A0A8K0GH26_IGNLU|nr:hypothetical protein ILUMI_07209 [Ignelater luminosus]
MKETMCREQRVSYPDEEQNALTLLLLSAKRERGLPQFVCDCAGIYDYNCSKTPIDFLEQEMKLLLFTNGKAKAVVYGTVLTDLRLLLIAQNGKKEATWCDPFLDDHLKKYENKGMGHVSYLSASICNEFIVIMRQVLKQIISELKKARYFSISVDSTPDVIHVDQLNVKYCTPVGRFLDFIPIERHGSKSVQNDSLPLDLALKLIDFLVAFVKDQRNKFGDYEARSRQRSSRLTFFDGAAEGTEFHGSEIFKVEIYLPITDKLISQLEQRSQAYKQVIDLLFGFYHI